MGRDEGRREDGATEEAAGLGSSLSRMACPGHVAPPLRPRDLSLNPSWPAPHDALDRKATKVEDGHQPGH